MSQTFAGTLTMPRKQSDEKMEWEDWAVVLVVLLFVFAVAVFVLTAST